MKNVDALFKIPILNFSIENFKLKQKQIEKVLKNNNLLKKMPSLLTLLSLLFCISFY